MTIAGIVSDRLYPLRLQHELADLIPTVERFETISSLSGHDGFLVETEQLGKIIAPRSPERDADDRFHAGSLRSW